MLKNILKLVFLGVIGFGLLVYLTADKPETVQVSENNAVDLNSKNFPKMIELVGQDKMVSSEQLFKKGTKTLLVVGNHDSLSVVKDLKKFYEINIPYVMVANISKAPWFIKKWVVSGKLEELNDDPTIPMIFDFDGSMVKSLNLDDTTKTSFFAYLVDENGSVSKIYTGTVKEDAMDGSMNESEKAAALKELINLI